tara:strand:+ start:1751 stop:2245 length:495 start_codon:yes stop_codon:yes gene_type:complete
MPKPKPNEVIRHELVLGRSERDLLETVTTAFTVNRVLAPFATILSSTAGVLLVAGLALAYLERYLPEGWREMTETQVFDWFETENLVVGGVFAGLGGLFGSVFGLPGAAAGATAGGIFGGIVQETAEEAQEGGVPKVLSYNQFAQIYGAALRLKNLIEEQENAS